MKRVAIIGSGGSGKSTLAKKLGSQLATPVYHLDSLYWKPGWVETDRAEWVKLQESICRKSSWIIDGNYGGTMDIRLRASDTIIFLDINRYVCLFNVLKRTLHYFGETRSDMGEGCIERFEMKFLRWIHSYPKKKPEILEKLFSLKENSDIYVLTTGKEIDDFLLHSINPSQLNRKT